MANMQVFEQAVEHGEEVRHQKRERQQAQVDEERRMKVADLYQQRNDIRDRISKLANTDPEYAKGEAYLNSIQTNLDQIYHPLNAPGALHRDWNFLTRLITRKKAAPAAPDTPLPTEAPADVKVSTGEQPVTLGATEAYKPALAGAVEPGTAAAEIKLPEAQISVPGTKQPTVVPVGAATSATMAVPPGKVKGLVAAGNLPIWNRPVIKNADGTVSTEYSTSFTDERPDSPYYGKEVLVPTVVNGKFIGTPDGKKPEEGSQADKDMKDLAWKNYLKTGQHLGVFDNAKNATAYAHQLHARGDKPKPDAAKYAPDPKSYEGKLAARKDQVAKEVEQFMAGAPLSPEQEARGEVQKKLVGIEETMKALKDLPGLDMDEDRLAEVKQQFIETALGITPKEKYFSQLQTTTDPVTGKVHVFRVPQKTGAMPEEIAFPEGQNYQGAAGKGGVGDGTKGDDFVKWLHAKFGPKPTPEQWEWGRQYWAKLGAHGTATYTEIDAQGGTTSRRVPIFSTPPAAGIGAQLGLGSAESEGAAVPAGGGGAGAPAGGGGGGVPSSGEASPLMPGMGANYKGGMGFMQEVEAVANYQVPMSLATSARGGQRSKFLQLVLQANPNFREDQYDSVQQTRKSFTAGGGDSRKIQSLGMSIGHLNNLAQAAAALDNGNLPDINKVRNEWRARTGDGRLTRFASGVNAVSGELASTFKGASGTDPEIDSWKATMSYDQSPEQMFAGIGNAMNLMASRMTTEADVYRNTFGSLKGFPPLGPETLQILTAYANPDGQVFKRMFPNIDPVAVGALKSMGMEGARSMLAVNTQALRDSGLSIPSGPPWTTSPSKPATATATAPAPAPRQQAAPTGGDVWIRDQNGQWFKGKKGTPIPPGYTVYAP